MPNDKPVHNISELLNTGAASLFGERKGIADIELVRLRPNPYQPRKIFKQEEIEELAASIEERGLLQPIRVAEIPDEPGFYYIILGERRVRAHEHLKLPTVKALITSWEAERAALDALVENIQRQDLDPFEVAAGVNKLMEQYGLTQEDVGKRLGKSRFSINRYVQIGGLPEAVRTDYESHPVSMTMLLEVAKHESPEKQLEAWQKVKKGQTTSSDVMLQERLAQTDLSPTSKPKPSENQKTLEKMEQAIGRFERLAHDDVRLESKRLEEYEELYKRFSAALERVRTKAKRGKKK